MSALQQQTMATFKYSAGFPDCEKVLANVETWVEGIPGRFLAFAVHQDGDRFTVTHESPEFEVSFDFPGAWTPIYIDGRPSPRNVPVQAVLDWSSENGVDFVRVTFSSPVTDAFWLELCFTRSIVPDPEP